MNEPPQAPLAIPSQILCWMMNSPATQGRAPQHPRIAPCLLDVSVRHIDATKTPHRLMKLDGKSPTFSETPGSDHIGLRSPPLSAHSLVRHAIDSLGSHEYRATLQLAQCADPRLRISAAGIHGRQPKNAIVGQFNFNFLLQRAPLHGLLIVAFDPDIAGRKLSFVGCRSSAQIQCGPQPLSNRHHARTRFWQLCCSPILVKRAT